METITAESHRTQRNCIFPRIPERGIRGKSTRNIVKFEIFCQTIVLHVALYVLFILSQSKGSEMQNSFLTFNGLTLR
ncbi:hypothetical protein D3OALGA1CA_3638 [Olavius algarvensis associated proteobacterium Delta 3]|nr:hypothetical protein D3OALGA1CA_3638 [Olavius algarvensis associated proteobacterium Delta 3]CAB5147554.1 hypothetical protein D3OALGB2SA_4600 [Olavius algarvensis associated proteobacterium Delta 3]